MVSLSSKDKSLLLALDNNVRLSYAQLAKKTHLTQETVRYRINNLEKSKIIRKYVTFFNSAKLGFLVYEVMLKLQNVNEQKKNKIIAKIIENENINWVANVEGNYDIAFIIAIRNQIELTKIIDCLQDLFKNTIIKKDIAIIISSQFFPRDYLVGKQRMIISPPAYQPVEKVLFLDEKETRVCHILAENGRTSYAEICKRAGISADTAVNKIKKLSQDHIITGSTIMLDGAKIGILHYKILLFLNEFTQEKVSLLLNTIQLNCHVITLVKTLAQWDYEIDIEIEDIHQLKEFTMELTSKFSNILRDYSTIRIINMPKFTFFNA